MFRRRQAPAEPVHIEFDGCEVVAERGDSVAAALLAAGVARFHDAVVSGAPRAPFCLIGQCFECLVEIDGVPNRQACMTEVVEGMRIRPQAALGSADR